MITSIRTRELAERTATLAEQAAQNGTFGVGGLLVDRDGNVIIEMMNTVIDQDGYLNDPTAHVECQIIDEYLAAHKQRRDPASPKRTDDHILT